MTLKSDLSRLENGASGGDTRPGTARASDKRLGRVEAALARELRVSKALRAVGVALGATPNLDEFLELILPKITGALEAESTRLYLIDEASDDLVSRVSRGKTAYSIRLKSGRGIAGTVARTGKSLCVREADGDPRFSAEWDMTSTQRGRSILAAPMRNHAGKTIGVVQVISRKLGEFTHEDTDILAALATQMAVSLDNARLLVSLQKNNQELIDTKEQLEHRVRDLKLLFDLEHAMGRAASLEELFIAVLGEAMRACEAKMAAVALRDPEAKTGVLHLTLANTKKITRVSYPEDAGLIGWAIRTGKVLVSGDAENDPRRDRALDDRAGGPTAKTAIAVPLEGESKTAMGAIAIYNKRGARPFSDEDRKLMELLAANASTAIRLQLSREVHEREERLTTIGRLLSSVIHDLKTPLAVIGGYVQMMQTSGVAAERKEFAGLILKQFDHIGAMQREVLEFARGERTILARKVYLQKFFEDARAQIEPDLARRGVKLVIDMKERGTARFDEGKMLRVVHNLARNAAEAMGSRGGQFAIKVARDKATSALVISFADTGPGIPKEIEHRLFQSFVTSSKKGGTGLGLAIVKKIANEHGGSIDAKSSSRGAEFTLRIPQPSPSQ